MLNTYKGEFASMSSMLVMEYFDEYEADYSEQNIIQYFIMKSYLKPKKIENKSHKDIWLSNLSKEDMTLASRNKINSIEDENTATWWEIYKDPLGYIWMAIAIPSHNSYIDKIDHLDAKISLLNLKTDIYYKTIDDEKISHYISTLDAGVNPGYLGSEFFWNQKGRTLTYTIPDYTSDDIPRLNMY